MTGTITRGSNNDKTTTKAEEPQTFTQTHCNSDLSSARSPRFIKGQTNEKEGPDEKVEKEKSRHTWAAERRKVYPPPHRT